MAAIAMALEQDLNRIRGDMSSTSFNFFGSTTSTCDTGAYSGGPVRVVERVVVKEVPAKLPLFATCQYCGCRNAPEAWECNRCGGPFPFD